MAVVAAGMAPVTIGLLNAQTVKPLRFEVASIKPADNGGRGGMELLPGGGLRMDGVTLYGLIGIAYNVRPENLSGGPKWTQSEAYAVLAKAEQSDSDDVSTARETMSRAAFDQLRERLRTLLAERFRLVIRTVDKESSGYVLVVAKEGTKLTPTTNPMPPGTNRSRGAITGRSGTMPMLASVLDGYLRHPVEDRTGLMGNYDYKLEYAEDLGPDAAAVGEPGASIFTAIQEQLGLKLESGRVTIHSIIVETAERPSPN